MHSALTQLGLSPFFSSQLTAEELAQGRLARVTQVQRSRLTVNDGRESRGVPTVSAAPEECPTVGDWVVLDGGGEKILRLLQRRSLFRRLAAGNRSTVQLIAANVDTLFIVTSCNEEFNESRLERYLALALEAGTDPVIVLTKADQAADPEDYARRARALRTGLPVEAVNALDPESLSGLMAWVDRGSTVALVGSSGVGKSTLVNSMSGTQRAQTGTIREGDARGRHTTSYRALHQLAGGGLLLDVPGMRELKLAEVEAALAEVFEDIDSLAQRCRFRDCDHDDEPGCAVVAAIDAGQLDPRRLANYRKLLREDARNRATLAEQRHRQRSFGKMIRQHLDLKAQAGKRQKN